MIWSNFLVQSFKLGAPTAPLQRGPVLRGSLSPSPPPVLRLLLRSPPRALVRSHDSVSRKGFFLGRERRSHTLEILEPRLLSHTSLAHEFTLTW